MKFRIAGFPVRIEAIFLITMAFLGFASGRDGLYVAEWVVVAGLSVLLHELGHAVAFRSFGSPAEITLHGFGGVTVGQAQPPKRSIVVSLAGPFAGFAVGLVVLAAQRSLGPQSGLVEQAFSDAIFVTFAWGLFNLVPMLPLDGGGVMASTIRLTTKQPDDRIAHIVSVVVAGALGVAGIASGRPFLAVVAGLFGFQNWQAIGRGRDEPQMQRLAQGQGMLLAGNSQEALSASEEVLRGPSSKPVETAAVELAAWSHLAAGRPAEASTALARLGGRGVSASHLLRSVVRLGVDPTSSDVAPALGHFTDLVYAPVAVAVLMDVGVLDAVLRDVAALPPDQALKALKVLQFGLQHRGHFPEAGRVGMALHERAPAPDTAYLVARSMAAQVEDVTPRLVDADHPDMESEALAWLSRAADLGWRDIHALDVDPNFASVRDTEGFRALRSWIESGATGPGPALGTAPKG